MFEGDDYLEEENAPENYNSSDIEEDYTSDDTPTSTKRDKKRKGSKIDQENELDVLKTAARSISDINRVATAQPQGPPPPEPEDDLDVFWKAYSAKIAPHHRSVHSVYCPE